MKEVHQSKYSKYISNHYWSIAFRIILYKVAVTLKLYKCWNKIYAKCKGEDIKDSSSEDKDRKKIQDNCFSSDSASDNDFDDDKEINIEQFYKKMEKVNS